jgi:hypothetical protein
VTVVLQVLMHQRAMTRVVVGLPNGIFDSLSEGRWTGPLTPTVLFVLCVVASVVFGLVLALLPRVSEPAGGSPPG